MVKRIIAREVASGALGMRCAVRGVLCGSGLTIATGSIRTQYWCSRQLYHPGAHAAHDERDHPVDPNDTVEVVEVAWVDVPELIMGDEHVGWEVSGNVLQSTPV